MKIFHSFQMDKSYKEDVYIQARNPETYVTDQHWYIGVWWTVRNFKHD